MFSMSATCIYNAQGWSIKLMTMFKEHTSGVSEFFVMTSSGQHNPKYSVHVCDCCLHTVSFHVMVMVCKVPTVPRYSARTLGTGAMGTAQTNPVK